MDSGRVVRLGENDAEATGADSQSSECCRRSCNRSRNSMAIYYPADPRKKISRTKYAGWLRTSRRYASDILVDRVAYNSLSAKSACNGNADAATENSNT